MFASYEQCLLQDFSKCFVIEKLTILDNCLMRYILGAHSKVPTEMLFLETAAIPIKYVIKCRRMIYLKEILDRKDNEIINKIYYTQKANPLKGDWWLLVQEDFNFICENINEDFIINMKTVEYKKYSYVSLEFQIRLESPSL